MLYSFSSIVWALLFGTSLFIVILLFYFEPVLVWIDEQVCFGSYRLTQTICVCFSIFANWKLIRPFFATQIKDLLITTDLKKGKVEIYNHQQKCWHLSQKLLKLPRKNVYYQQALIGSELYAFGSFLNKNKHTNEILRLKLNVRSSRWTSLAKMQENRKDFSTVVFNNTIYVFGGVNSQKKYLKSCERYCSIQNKWLTVADMEIARACASAAVINGYIYIAGGQNSNTNNRTVWLDSVEIYNPNIGTENYNTWNPAKPMATVRSHFALTPFAGRLWAIGGSNSGALLSKCESYDPDTKTWRNEKQLEVERMHHAAIEYYGELYVVGGTNNNVEKCVPSLRNILTFTKVIVDKYSWVIDSNINFVSNNLYSNLLIMPNDFLVNFKRKQKTVKKSKKTKLSGL